MRTLRLGASTIVIAGLLIGMGAGPSSAQSRPSATGWTSRGGHVETGGDIKFDPRDKRAGIVAPQAPRKTETSSLLSNTWIGDLVERLIAGEPTAATRSKRIAKARLKRGPLAVASHAPMASHVAGTPAAPPNVAPATSTPANTSTPAPIVVEATPATHQPGPQAAKSAEKSALPSILTRPAEAAPITTGTLPVPPTPPSADGKRIDPTDKTAQIILEAERVQSRLDLVKLELASRTYDETRLSGQSVFDLRTDWRVLERAHDSLSAAELAVAESSGFEANAYINEVDKVIVVAIAGTQDLKHGFLEESFWRALIQSQAPQQFFLAKSYTRSIIQRYQMKGFTTECTGHSLGGGACAYAASELGIRAIVINPISAGPLSDIARHLVTNYIVDGDIASIVYPKRGNEISGEVQHISTGTEAARQHLIDRYGLLAGPILVVRGLRDSVRVHQIDRALDLLAVHAGTERVR